jgi:hypothetical protein
MSEIIYDFRAIGDALRRQRLDDWWQPAKPEPELQAAEPGLDREGDWSLYVIVSSRCGPWHQDY